MSEVLNIVYVDDDADDHLFFQEALKKLDMTMYHVTELYNGSQLLDFLFKADRYKNSQEPTPDLIILDINMPVMNGITVLRTLKLISKFKHIPVFILSTSNDQILVEECAELGATGFYTKPIRIEQLRQVIEDILNGVKQKV